MTSPNAILNRDESHNDVSESFPLLRDRIEVAIQEKRLFWQKHWIKLLLCAFSFIMMLGDNLQPAALTQILETIICDDYYRVHPLPTGPPAHHFKVQPVQKELALLRGFQQLVPLFPGLLCTVSYGLLADRIGRKRVLVLTGLAFWLHCPGPWPYATGELSPFAGCYFRGPSCLLAAETPYFLA